MEKLDEINELNELIARREQLILDIEAAKKRLQEVSIKIESLCVHGEICEEEYHDFDRTRYCYHCIMCSKRVNRAPYMNVVKRSYYG